MSFLPIQSMRGSEDSALRVRSIDLNHIMHQEETNLPGGPSKVPSSTLSVCDIFCTPVPPAAHAKSGVKQRKVFIHSKLRWQCVNTFSIKGILSTRHTHGWFNAWPKPRTGSAGITEIDAVGLPSTRGYAQHLLKVRLISSTSLVVGRHLGTARLLGAPTSFSLASLVIE